MSKTDEEWAEDAEAWFFNLENLAVRIEQNEKKHRQARRRQNVIFAFVVFAFLLLAWRSETNSDRIARNSNTIGKQQLLFRQQEIQSCMDGLMIVVQYNKLQDDMIEIETTNPFIDDALRRKRILAYKAAKISPSPTCDALISRHK